MDQYSKIMLTIITVCVAIITIIKLAAIIIHDHDNNHDHDYFEYMEHVIERLEIIEEKLD